ncbi:hypothetical protein Y032_0207g2045 [Ancylostoma ceylanicum]|uniref:Uncharacterized protein n=1 Tax=Ancylostoma ceylanicum TaxID=53326 RepID=A0A016SLY2_9BILA|nr:hypothetical protein Y032_0207g2045 [Ancylostoma ceylanicum]
MVWRVRVAGVSKYSWRDSIGGMRHRTCVLYARRRLRTRQERSSSQTWSNSSGSFFNPAERDSNMYIYIYAWIYIII